MKMVSNGYKATMNLPVRPTSQFQARLELRDREFESQSAVSQSLKAPFATSVLDKTHECDYLTFEKNFFTVGGNALIAPDSNFRNNGYVRLTDSCTGLILTSLPFLVKSTCLAKRTVFLKRGWTQAYLLGVSISSTTRYTFCPRTKYLVLLRVITRLRSLITKTRQTLTV